MRRALLLAFLAAPARGEDAAPTPDEINNRAIDAGVAWLKSAQREDGSFGPCMPSEARPVVEAQWRLGPTALTIFSLAVCGVPREDTAVQRGLKWLEATATRTYEYGSYESAAVILMLTALHGVKAPERLVRTGSRRTPRSGFSERDWLWMVSASST